MQREIKLRAFVRNSYMVDVVSIDFVNKYITWNDNQYDRCVPPNKCYETESFEEIKLMQFTGLKDRSGKEIWEGDVVKFINKNGGKEYVRQIVWHQQCCQYKISNSKNRLKGTNPLYAEKVYNCDLVVIGNIYEHPNLLK